MLTRLPLLASALFTFVAACADDPAAPLAPERFGSRAPAAGAIDPGPRPEIIEPVRCLAVDSGAVQYGTTAHDEVRDVAILDDGTILAAGLERGIGLFGGGPEANMHGTVDAFARDLASSERRALLDHEGTDTFESIAIAPDTGRVWLAARSNGTIPGLPSRGNFDVVLGALADDGFVPLARGFDDASEQPRQLAVASGGVLAIAGEEKRTVEQGALNPWFATYQAEADGVATRAFASRQRAELESYRAVDAMVNVIAVGGGTSDGAEAGMFIETYTPDTARGWRRQLSTLGSDTVTGVKFLADGDVVFTGTTKAQLGDTQHGGFDVVIGRLDGATGATEWIAQLGSTADERAADLAVDRDGRIHVVGTVLNGGDFDAFLMVVDADGALLLEEGWASPGRDVPTAVAVDGCGGIVVAGYTTGDLAGTPLGGHDSFLLVTRLAAAPATN